MAKVKITVIKKHNYHDDFSKNPPMKMSKEMLHPDCHVFNVGQEFIVDSDQNSPESENWMNCPPGFCSWAYADIQRDVMHILFGGSYHWIEEKGVSISCCTDGLSPVVFRIERIE